MKKLISALLICMMIFTLTGCQEERTVIMSMSNYDGKHEIQIEAVGNEVKKITQTSTLEIEGYSETQINEIVADLEEEHASLTKGITFSVKHENSTLIKTYTLDATNKFAIEAANGYGFFSFNAGTKKITLKNYLTEMKSKGFTIIEETKK